MACNHKQYSMNSFFTPFSPNLLTIPTHYLAITHFLNFSLSHR